MIEIPIIRNTCFWYYVPLFIRKDILLKEEDYMIVGYFPYHTAKILSKGHLVQRSFFTAFEEILKKHKIYDNKAVYICETNPNSRNVTHFRWAVMLKDEWFVLGSWEEVTDYNGNELKRKL